MGRGAGLPGAGRSRLARHDGHVAGRVPGLLPGGPVRLSQMVARGRLVGLWVLVSGVKLFLGWEPAPVPDAIVVELVDPGLGLERRLSDRVTAPAAVLQPEQAEPDAGQAGPEPPAPTGVVELTLA